LGTSTGGVASTPPRLLSRSTLNQSSGGASNAAAKPNVKVLAFQYYPAKRGILFIVLARELVIYDITARSVCSIVMYTLQASK
jgi:hypothetical protein